MKKFVITTALALTITTTNANAYDRFNNLRPSQPTIEVNYGALQYLEPDIFVGSNPPPMHGKMLAGANPEGQIHAMPRSLAKPEKIATSPVAPIKGTENKPKIAKKPAPVAKAAPKTTLAENTAAPKIVSSQKPTPKIVTPSTEPVANKTEKIKKPVAPQPKSEIPLEAPNFDKPIAKSELKEPLLELAPIPAPTVADIKENPKIAPKAPELKAMPEALPEVPDMPEPPKEVPKAVQAGVEEIKQDEFPKLADIDFPEIKAEPEKTEAPKMPPMPEMPEIPALPELKEAAPISPTTDITDTNTVVLPPLFPNGDNKIAAPTPEADVDDLPSLDKLFAEKIKEAEAQQQAQADSADSITIPPIPKNGTDDLPQIPAIADTPAIPAPEIENVQINNQIANIPTSPAPAKEISYSVPFNETETEFPLAEQPKLDEIAASLKANADMTLTVSGYASGSAEQSSQAKRTSLSRALSVRRYLLQKGIESEQIIIRPYGNESESGVPDRVDLQLSKKLGA